MSNSDFYTDNYGHINEFVSSARMAFTSWYLHKMGRDHDSDCHSPHSVVEVMYVDEKWSSVPCVLMRYYDGHAWSTLEVPLWLLEVPTDELRAWAYSFRTEQDRLKKERDKGRQILNLTNTIKMVELPPPILAGLEKALKELREEHFGEAPAPEPDPLWAALELKYATQKTCLQDEGETYG